MNVLQGHSELIEIAAVESVVYDFLLVTVSDYVSILHWFRCITTYAVYLIADDLEKYFNFNNRVQITSHQRLICV